MGTKTINKVAEITLLFWLMKIVATTLGETLGDFISMTLNLGYSTGIVITGIFFLALLFIQLKATNYKPIIFWLLIIATTTLGTEISDFIDRSLHLGYTYGSLLLFFGLIITLCFWYNKYKNLKVSQIIENKKEIFFWIAVLFSNSLGTAFGDYLGDVIGLSYLQGALLTALIIIIVVLLHYLTKLNEVFLFWLAFVFTRPFGATFGDFLTKPIAKGGLDLGTLQASLVSIFIMVIMIYFSHKQLKKTHS
ncbi:hypothetical protein [uncultured Flavobacterium sp.]|uniref:COG4705 family protein n=1 Tax=uncultured Flavobacterium sp. TaxID=165435 RepID=UPI0030EEC5C4|tara:strand:+ start:261782 stop:262531 length:750 start_codon:yes stop_codon:yes gene_type:complete